MATASNVLRTCGLLLYLFFQVHISSAEPHNSTLQSIIVGSVTCDQKTCKYLLSVSGGEFLGHNAWRLTAEEGVKGGSCDIIYPNYELKEIETSQLISKLEVSLPFVDGRIYFCLREDSKSPFNGLWVHQGVEYFLEPTKDVAVYKETGLSKTTESKSKQSKEKSETQQNQNMLETSNGNDTQVNSQWKDLTHDIDVNYLPNAPRPTREEKKDIEVFIHNKYVPLNDIIENDLTSSIDSLDKLKENTHNVVNDDIALKSNSRMYVDITNGDEFDYAREIINKIDLAISKLQKSKREVNKSAAKKNKNVKSLKDISNDISNENAVNFITSPMPYQDMEIEDLNSVNNISPKDILDKLNELLAKIQTLKCGMHSPSMHSPNMPSDKVTSKILSISMHAPSSGSPGFDSTSLKSSNTDVRGLESSNIDIPDQKSSGMNFLGLKTHLPDLKSSGTNLLGLETLPVSSDLESTGKHLPDLESFGTYSSGLITSDIDSRVSQMLLNVRDKRQIPEVPFTSVRAAIRPIMIEGLRIENSDKEPKIIEDGVPSVLAESSVILRVYGAGLTERTVIAFTHDPQPYGQPCKFLLKGEYKVKEGSLKQNTALFQIYAPAPITDSKLYICAKNLQPDLDTENDEEKYIHQGTESWRMMASHNKLLPLWVSIGLILFCLMFSALFSGLNLGLMSLDRTELKIISNTGTEQERKFARAIMPVRDHGNYLLCSILLGNVAVNSTFTILLDELTSGLFAVIFSTLAIVLLGEITPQAICSRHGLMVGAKSIMVTKGVMAVTAPLSFPVSKLLDYFLGEEIGNVYNRERLKELVKVTTDVNDLDKDEVNIISGALEMRKKTVKDVMTKLEDAFMLPISSVLDFETMSEIVKSGYSRIPVYEGGRGNIVTVLFIKDLAFVDPDDNTPLRTLCQYYQNAAHFVFEDVTLDVMFKQFKDGHKGHMAFVHRINNEGEGDPFYETIGLVTLEDVIEEMIQSEIVDETDVFLDNRSKRRRRPQNKLQDFAAFAERHENQRIHISPQLTLATFQFLSTSVDAFRPDTVSETVLRRLLRQDVIQHIKVKEKTKRDPHTYVFQQGKPVDYFVLILEGRVEVTVGRENLVFEAGPFTYFGVQALTQNIGVAESPTPSAMGSLQNINMDAMLRHTFVPDYSVRAITSVFYLTVKRSLYLAAKRATLMEKGNISKGGTTLEFDTEVDKNLTHTSSGNIPMSRITKKLFGKSTSTLSTREDPLSSTSGIKPQPRLNIIELMQVTPQNYPSSERVDVSEKYLKRVANTGSVSDPDKIYTILQRSNSDTHKNAPKSNQEFMRELSKSSNCHVADVDANSCVECIRNNFWITKTALSKSADDRNDFGPSKKKKASFHADSSLLSFHNLSSTSHAVEEIEYKSNNQALPNKDLKIENPENLNYKVKSNSNYKIDKYQVVQSNRNERFYARSPGVVIYTSAENCSPFRMVNSDTAKIDKDLDYIPENLNRRKDYDLESNQAELDRQNDYKDYKPYETDSSNHEHKSNNQEIESTDPPDSIDRFLELERDTIDYEKEFREERLAVEKRRLETEQIMMMQLSKIIKMLERKQP